MVEKKKGRLTFRRRHSSQARKRAYSDWAEAEEGGGVLVFVGEARVCIVCM